MLGKSKVLIVYHFCMVIKAPVTQGYCRIKPFQQEKIFRKQILLQRNLLSVKSIGLLNSKGVRGFPHARRNTSLCVPGGRDVPLPVAQSTVSLIAQLVTWNCFGTPQDLVPVGIME